MYYVYTLAYPDGTIFYVGKGQGHRVHDHERAVTNNRYSYNLRKSEIIQDILDRGEEVLKTIVAEFVCEKDAYIYEWGLMCMYCRADQLTNMKRAIIEAPIIRPHRTLVLDEPVCLLHGARYDAHPKYEWITWATRNTRVRAYHLITDMAVFAKEHYIPLRNLPDLLNGTIKQFHGWSIIKDCDCQEESN